MADYISREAAKSKKVYSVERHEYVIPVAEIDWLPAADVRPANEWISVKGRLPTEQGKRYLVRRWDGVTKTHFTDILWYDAHDLWWNRLYGGDYGVSHWMPLPEPPKEEKE